MPILSIQPFNQDGYEYAVKIKTMNVAKHDDLQRMVGYQIKKYNTRFKVLAELIIDDVDAFVAFIGKLVNYLLV